MQRILRKTIGAMVAIAALAPMTAVNAKANIKDLTFHVVQDQFTQMPTLEMRHDGKNWVWANKGDGFNIKVKVNIRSVGNKFGDGRIFVPQANMVLWQMPTNLNTRDFETLDTVNVGKAMLTNFQGDAANLCSVFGGEKKSVRDLDAKAVLSVQHGGDIHAMNGSLPLKVVCMPVEPHRVPTELRVTQLKVYTVPAAAKCNQPVQLITEIHTNVPGKVEFQLSRRDGEKQMASLTTEKVGNYAVKRWSKTYKYSQSIRREYMVIIKGQPVSSDWVPVEVDCGAGSNKRPKGLAN